MLPQLLVFTALTGRMHVLASWLVPAWWLLLPLAADWLAGLRRPRLRAWTLAAGWGTVLLLPPLLTLAAQVRWGLFDHWLPAGLDTSTQLIPPDSLRRDLQRHPAVWKALQDADLIAANRYDLPGFLSLALGRNRAMAFTTFSPDARGFAWWQPAGGFRGSRGVVFGIVEPNGPSCQTPGGPGWAALNRWARWMSVGRADRPCGWPSPVSAPFPIRCRGSMDPAPRR